jgi:hypothetical protein
VSEKMKTSKNETSFSRLARMDKPQFDRFLKSEFENIEKNLKSLRPDATCFRFFCVEDIYILNKDQLYRFLPDFIAWQSMSYKATLRIPKLFRGLVRVSQRMIWINDGHEGNSMGLEVILEKRGEQKC